MKRCIRHSTLFAVGWPTSGFIRSLYLSLSMHIMSWRSPLLITFRFSAQFHPMAVQQTVHPLSSMWGCGGPNEVRVVTAWEQMWTSFLPPYFYSPLLGPQPSAISAFVSSQLLWKVLWLHLARLWRYRDRQTWKHLPVPTCLIPLMR